MSEVPIITLRTADLYLRDMFSDKVYTMWLNQHSDTKLCELLVSYGKRKAFYKTTYKKFTDLSEFKANQEFDKILKQKLNKGYRER